VLSASGLESRKLLSQAVGNRSAIGAGSLNAQAIRIIPEASLLGPRLERAYPFPAIEDTRPGNRALRPPLAPRPLKAPVILAPVPSNPAPVPVPAPAPRKPAQGRKAISIDDIPRNADAILAYAKREFRKGVTLARIASQLAHWSLPAPHGNGCPIGLVKEQLGHASLETTSVYVHARPSDGLFKYLR
jgi:hypothetical protein